MLATMRPAAQATMLAVAFSLGPGMGASPVQQPAADTPPATPQPVMTVVIDPGHGGDDRGAVGPSGVEEKQLTLSVAHRVRALGGERGVRVLLTREDDRQVSLMQRAAFANGAGAAVLVSLHANASPSPLSAGPEVASFGGAPAPPEPLVPFDDKSLAVPLMAGGSRRIVAVPWEFAQAGHVEVAAAFAAQLGEMLERVAPLGPRGVYQSLLRPLTAVNVPSVLVELGYVSNPEEEKLAAGEMRQVALAQAVVDALLVFDWTPPRPAPTVRSGGR
jgi:N-acetylmuramoyl-L-alanine amidase